MKHNLFYRTLKLSLGFILAVVITDLLHINFALSAGIITILNMLDTKKDSVKVSWRRLYSSLIGISLSALIFSIFGYHVLNIALFLILFIPITTHLKAKEGLIVNIVLASHLIILESASIPTLLNEFYLVLIGGGVALLLNSHMPSRRKHLVALQQTVDNQIRGSLLTISYSLRNLCTVNSVEPSIDELEKSIKKGKKLSYEHMNNAFFTEDRYYLEYFQMRLTQFHRLKYMREHLKMVFVIQEEAMLLSSFFEELALNYQESNDGKELLMTLNTLREQFQLSPLPQSQLAFENRSALFQTLSDLEAFIKVKLQFIEQQSVDDQVPTN